MKFQCLIIAGAAVFAALPVGAQPISSGYRAYEADPAAQLSANLVVLSQNPRDVNALIGAGQSAVAVGDGNAALAFLARAEEISPRNGRIKAALGSALLLLERPGEALKLFAEASALGVPDADIAADRGLAHDLKGENRKAQRDYLLVQRIAPSDEITRRLALSYGISGDRSDALTLLDPLLRKQDQAAWRARAFILAMTGDLDDAEDIARTVMPAGIGSGMRPFLRKLATLSPADRAMAVNFGTMPGDGMRLATGAIDGNPGQAGTTLIPAGDSAARPADTARPAAKVVVSRDPRRRPGAADPAPVWNLAGSLPTTPRPQPVPPAAAANPPVSSSVRIEQRLAPAAPDRRPSEIASLVAANPPSSSRIAEAPATVRPTAVVAGAGAVDSRIIGQRPQVATPLASGPAPVFEVPPSAAPPAATTIVAVTPATPSVGVVTNQIAPPPAIPAALDAPIARPGFTEIIPAEPAVASVIVAKSPLTQPTGANASAAAPTLAAQPAVTPPATEADRGTQAIASFAIGTPSAVATPWPDPVKAPPTAGLAEIIAAIEPEVETAAAPLPTAAELRAARVAQQKRLAVQAKAEADAKSEKDARDAARKEAAKHPARVWVQVATGSNEAGLPATWKRIRDKSPALFKGLGAASVPFKATNRLLVGPFKSQAEARALVNAMQKSGFAGTTFASEAGQDIARIAAR